MSAWIDFKALRAQLKFEDVLRHYGVEVKSTNRKQHQCYCPLPNHNGKRNSPSFSANLERGIFNCFGCGAKGNLIDFAVLMAGGSPDNGADVRKAALLLQEKFCPQQSKTEKAKQNKSAKHEASQAELLIKINEPLNFKLKRLEAAHPYLDKRGFTRETIATFGLGYCAKGLLAERIAIPVHDQKGQLLGYCGRIVDDTRINEDNPRFKFPSKREHKGVIYEFHKLLLLYNVQRIQKPVDDLIVVEGFASVWWLTQMGFPHVVALMGWVMSEEQAKIVLQLVSPTGRVWLVPDGDESGLRCALSVFERIAPHRFLRWLKLDEGKQPTDYPGGWYRTQFSK